MKQILIVDDDAEIRTLLADYLEKNGFRVFTLPDGRAVWQELEQRSIDLVVLDIMMPGIDGLAVCRALRDRRHRVPVLMLSARGEEIDRIVGLETGADDYLAKPFHPRELLARVNAILKRSAHDPGAPPVLAYRFAGHTLDVVRRELVADDGHRRHLTGAEFELLAIFVSRPNRVLSRDLLVELTQRREAPAYDRSIDVRVSRLRHLLTSQTGDARLIQTVYGEGYVFATTVEVVEAAA